MKNLIDTIETNFDLFDFLSHKYENYDFYKGIELDSYFTEKSFDKNILKKYRDKINWDKVSLIAPLTEDLIDEFFEELRGCRIIIGGGSSPAAECLFSENTHINWTESLLEKYKEYVYWHAICQNPSVPWNEKLIDRYLFSGGEAEDHWISLSSNPGIIWDEQLITKYYSYLYLNCLIKYSKIFWDTKLLNSTLELIEIENQRHYLIYFSEIKNIKWDIETIISYPNSYSYWLRNVIENKTIELNFDILRNYLGKIDKNLFAIIQVSNDLIWSKELIKEFLIHIDFEVLSKSENVEWSIEILDEFKDDLNFTNLSKNYSIVITDEMIRKYSEKWDFKFLSINRKVCWDLENMEEFIERIELDEIIENPKIIFTAEFIERFKNKFTWNGKWRKFGSDGEKYYASKISQQPHLPISVSTLIEMASKWEVGCTEWSGSIDDIKEWYYYSMNNNLTPDHLSNFKDLFSWEILSKNKNLKISREILSEYADKWDYSEIFKRDDIDWDIEVFCKVSVYINWDIFKEYESKIMDILHFEENTIFHYFTFINAYKRPLHSKIGDAFVNERKEREILTSKLVDICNDALIEADDLNYNDSWALWNWLKTYMNIYYENTDLSKRLIRIPKSYYVHNHLIKTDLIRSFVFKYEGIKNRFDKIIEES